MKLTKHEVEEANKRAASRLRREPRAISARYERGKDRVVIGLSTGIEIVFQPERVQGLAGAKPHQLGTIEISPSGFGLHFPKLDADLYLPALLEGFLGSRRWMAARLGKLGGRVSSSAKASAARANGRLGGRPRRSEHAA
jgi:hypothetical protein